MGSVTQRMPPVCSGTEMCLGVLAFLQRRDIFLLLCWVTSSVWGQFKAEVIGLLKILAEQICFSFCSAKQNGVWVKEWLFPQQCAATLWIEEQSLEHRRAIAAVQKCQHGALFPAFLTSVVVVVGWSCAAVTLLVQFCGHSSFVTESGHLEERDSRTSLSHTREFLTWRRDNRMPL